MAKYLNSNSSANTESRVHHKDFVIVISTVCGLAAIIIGIIVIFLRRRFRNKDNRDTMDVEMRSMKAFSKETERLISKSPLVIKRNHEANNSTRESISFLQRDDICTNSEFFNRNKHVDDDSRDDEDLNNEDIVSGDLFTFLYPQFSRLNVPHGPNIYEGHTKSSVSITEITDEEEIKDPLVRNLDKIKDEKDKAIDECEQEESSDHRNPFNYDSSTENGDASPFFKSKVEIDLDAQSRICQCFKSDTKTTESEDNSRDFVHPKRSRSSSSFIEEAVTKEVVQSFLILKNPPLFLDQVDLGLGVLPNLICSEMGGGMTKLDQDNKMSAKFEYLKEGVNLGDVLGDEIEPIEDRGFVSVANFDEIDIIDPILQINIENDPIIELGVPHRDQGDFIKSAGDNIYQDDFLRDSSETSTLTSWPGRTINVSNTQIHQGEQSSSCSTNDQQNAVVGPEVERSTVPQPCNRFGKKFDFSFTMPSGRNDFGFNVTEQNMMESVCSKQSKKQKNRNLEDIHIESDFSQISLEDNTNSKMSVQKIKREFCVPDADNRFDKSTSNSSQCVFLTKQRIHKKPK